MIGALSGLWSRWRRAQKPKSQAPLILDQIEAEQLDLQRRWRYLAEAQRLSHSGTFGWKVSSGELIWSDETYRILGFTPETNLTLDLLFDRIHPEDRVRMQEVRDRAARNGMDMNVEHRILLPDGGIRYLHSVAHAGRDGSGNLEYMGVVTDITDSKRAEQERQALSRKLEESNARLEEAQRVAHVGYWIWNLDTNQVVFSGETCRIYGIEPQDSFIDLDAIRELIHPEDREYVFANAERGIRDGVRIETEHRLIRPNGEIRVVNSLGDLTRDASGRSYEMFGTCQDITDRRTAEEERQALSRDLQESKAWLEEAQRVAHVGYWVWDIETNQVIWSEECYRIYGLTPQTGSFDVAKVGDMMHPDDREAVFRIAEEAIRSGARADCEHRLIRPDGEIRFIHSLGDLKKTSDGRTQMFGTAQDITDRKHEEEERRTLSSALQRSNAGLEEAQRVAHIGHYEFDPVKNQVTWSAELCRIWGIPPTKDPIDMAVVFEMIHPEDREYAARTVESIIRSGIHLKAEHRIVRPDGEVRFLQVLGTVKRDASGHAYELFGTGQDITDRKLSDQALRRNQFYLSEGERLAHIGSWAFNESGHYWSDELYKIYGLEPRSQAPSVEEYLTFIHPQDRASMAETIKIMQEQHRGHDLIERIIRPDGKLRYIRAVAVPVIEEGVFKGFVGTTMDVTEQELLTQELRREQTYFAEAQSLAHIGSWATNFATGQIHHISDETFRLHGFDPREGPIPLDRFFNTLHPEDEPMVKAVIENAIRSKTDYDIREFRIRRADDGQIRFLRTIGHRNLLSEPGEYVGITVDVTDRKHAEQERERLRQLEADLSHINRVNMMGELAAALAHEIKQPIAASITSANALQRWLAHDPPDIERARAAATRIEQDANRAADVIGSLQSFYKAGVPVEKTSISLSEVVEEMIVLLRTEAVRNAVVIHSALDPDLPNIYANKVQLQQVLMNLMLNAIEAMSGTGGDLTVKAQLNTEGRLVVSIQDTGMGLSKTDVEKIFDPFHTSKPQGTGMGLTITRSILESYGGRVWATSNEGPGATFTFVLPCEFEAQS